MVDQMIVMNAWALLLGSFAWQFLLGSFCSAAVLRKRIKEQQWLRTREISISSKKGIKAVAL